MDLAYFSALLSRTYSSANEERSDAYIKLEDVMKEDPLIFLLNLIIAAQNCSGHIADMAITLLYSVFLHNTDILNEEIVFTFFKQSSESIKSILKSATIDFTKKCILSYTVAIIYFLYKDKTEIKDFILLNSNEDLELIPCFAVTLTNILSIAGKLCNFEIEDLKFFLTANINNLIRVELYFSIASIVNSENSDINAMIPFIMDLIDKSSQKYECFRVMEKFTLNHAVFFASMIESVGIFVINSISNSDDDIKRICLHILGHFMINECGIVNKSKSFKVKVLKTFINVVNTASDKNYIYTNNGSIDPSKIALFILNTETEFENNDYIDEEFHQLEKEVLVDKTKIDMAYGLLMTLATKNMTKSFNRRELIIYVMNFIRSGLPDKLLYASLYILNSYSKNNSVPFFDIYIDFISNWETSNLSTISNSTFLMQIFQIEKNVMNDILKTNFSVTANMIRTITTKLLQFIKLCYEPSLISSAIDIITLCNKIVIRSRIAIRGLLEPAYNWLSCNNEDIQASSILLLFECMKTYINIPKEKIEALLRKTINILHNKNISNEALEKLNNIIPEMLDKLNNFTERNSYLTDIFNHMLPYIAEAPSGFQANELDVTSSDFIAVQNNESGTWYFDKEQVLRCSLVFKTISSELNKCNNLKCIYKILDYSLSMFSSGIYIDAIDKYAFDIIIKILFLSRNEEMFYEILNELRSILKIVFSGSSDLNNVNQLLKVVNKIISEDQTKSERCKEFAVEVLNDICIFVNKCLNNYDKKRKENRLLTKIWIIRETSTNYKKKIHFAFKQFKLLSKIIPDQVKEVLHNDIIPRMIKYDRTIPLGSLFLSFLSFYITLENTEECYIQYKSYFFDTKYFVVILIMIISNEEYNYLFEEEEEDNEEKEATLSKDDIINYKNSAKSLLKKSVAGLTRIVQSVNLSRESLEDILNNCFDKGFISFTYDEIAIPYFETFYNYLVLLVNTILNKEDFDLSTQQINLYLSIISCYYPRNSNFSKEINNYNIKNVLNQLRRILQMPAHIKDELHLVFVYIFFISAFSSQCDDILIEEFITIIIQRNETKAGITEFINTNRDDEDIKTGIERTTLMMNHLNNRT